MYKWTFNCPTDKYCPKIDGGSQRCGTKFNRDNTGFIREIAESCVPDSECDLPLKDITPDNYQGNNRVYSAH